MNDHLYTMPKGLALDLLKTWEASQGREPKNKAPTLWWAEADELGRTWLTEGHWLAMVGPDVAEKARAAWAKVAKRRTEDMDQIMAWAKERPAFVEMHAPRFLLTGEDSRAKLPHAVDVTCLALDGTPKLRVCLADGVAFAVVDSWARAMLGLEIRNRYDDVGTSTRLHIFTGPNPGQDAVTAYADADRRHPVATLMPRILGQGSFCLPFEAIGAVEALGAALATMHDPRPALAVAS